METDIRNAFHRLALVKNIVFWKLRLLPSSVRNLKRILLGIHKVYFSFSGCQLEICDGSSGRT